MDNSDKAEICQGLYYKEIIFSIIINDYKQQPLKCKANQNYIVFNIIILLINFSRKAFFQSCLIYAGKLIILLCATQTEKSFIAEFFRNFRFCITQQ